VSTSEPPRDCQICPRLAAFRATNRSNYVTYFNNPVPGFGSHMARLLIVGLAPGLHGANRTGRPFTGDYAGDLLYPTLIRHGLARGDYLESANDGLELVETAITNAVRCVPPQNKPLPSEIKSCRTFLNGLITTMPHLRVVLALGKIAHDSVCDALAVTKSKHRFAHGAQFERGKITLVSSYHCSRYNTNTGVLNQDMFDNVIKQAKIAAMHAL